MAVRDIREKDKLLSSAERMKKIMEAVQEAARKAKEEKEKGAASGGGPIPQK